MDTYLYINTTLDRYDNKHSNVFEALMNINISIIKEIYRII